MNQRIATQMSHSAQCFQEIVWPKFQPHFRNSKAKFYSSEAVTNSEFSKQLDMISGIDAWLIECKEQGYEYIRGLASRIQWGTTNWRTFTIRKTVRSGYPTEYQKRLKELLIPGAITPHYCAHAYLTKDDKLLGGCIALMQDVIRCVEKEIGWSKSNPQDGTIFWIVPWDELKTRRCPMIEIKEDTAQIQLFGNDHA